MTIEWARLVCRLPFSVSCRGLCSAVEGGYDSEASHSLQRVVGHDGLPGHGHGHPHWALRPERRHVDIRPDCRALPVCGSGGHGESTQHITKQLYNVLFNLEYM